MSVTDVDADPGDGTPLSDEPSAPPADRIRLRTLLRSPWTIAVVVLGLVIRWRILSSPLGQLSADEVYTGLQAAEILRGNFPVVIGGLTYTAPVESYLFAPFVAVFGLHVVPLKLLSSVGWGVAAVLMVGAARRITTDRAAALAGSLVWLAPGALTILTTRAYVGYSTGLAAVIATLWATLVLVEVHRDASSTDDQMLARHSAVVGFLAGTAVYFHPMFMAVVAPMMLVPAVLFLRRLAHWWVPAALGAIAANLPFLIWNAVNGFPSLDQPAEASEPATDRFVRFITGLVPRMLGLRGGGDDWVFGRLIGLAVYAALIALVVLGTVVAVRRSGRSGRSGWVLAAPLALSWFLMAFSTNLSFVADGRYAIIVFPFVVLALVVGVTDLVGRLGDGAARALGPAVVAVWVLGLTLPWFAAEAGTLRSVDPDRQTREIVTIIADAGFERVAGTYWFVFPVEYVSQRSIRSAVSGHPFVILFPENQAMVDATPPDELALVFDGPAPGPLLRLPLDQYEQRQVGSAVIYLPIATEPPTDDS